MAIDCAKDMDDNALTGKYQNKAAPQPDGLPVSR
jgi:hypothetical protein